VPLAVVEEKKDRLVAVASTRSSSPSFVDVGKERLRRVVENVLRQPVGDVLEGGVRRDSGRDRLGNPAGWAT
jgi:hypothetical protein